MGQNLLGLLLMAMAVFGATALSAQLLLVAWWRLRRPAPRSSGRGVSVLKPLCGLDDDLEENLESFRRQSHRNYEVLLGVKSEADPAYPLARRFAERWPELFRLVLQRGEVGMNPKVNQLITLAGVARHELLFVSDSNVRLQPEFLGELAAEFDDPELALVTNPVVGVGERTTGAMLESLHLAASIGSGMISAPASSGQYVVVGKSMCLRRSALEAIGGLEAYANHLAEDFVIGRTMMANGQKIAVGRLPCQNVSGGKTLRQFWQRYARWSVIHRTAVSGLTYFGQGMLNPIPFGLLGAALLQNDVAGRIAVGIALLKCAVDFTVVRLLRPAPIPLSAALLVPLKDLILFAAWTRGLVVRTVEWRGNRLRVTDGSRLLPDEALELAEVPPAG